MVRKRGEIKAVCQNIYCDYYLKEKGKNIIKRGKSKTGRQRYYCKYCGTLFVETKGTLLYNKHLSKSEIVEICGIIIGNDYIFEKSYRYLEKETGHAKETILQLFKSFIEHSDEINSILIEYSDKINSILIEHSDKINYIPIDDVKFEIYKLKRLWIFILIHKNHWSKDEYDQIQRIITELNSFY